MKRSRMGLLAVFCFVAGMLTAAWFLRFPPTVVEGEEAAAQPRAGVAAPPEDGKLRIICFGAHPDDCEIQAGGVAALWAAQGHHVKFVSVTNGDIGHWREAGGPLARRRTAEAERADHILGITSQVLDMSPSAPK
jgi:hypothetical protein